MIDVAKLINESNLSGNYFASDVYIQGDFESGLLENRQGGRLIALSKTLITGLYRGVNAEVGSAAGAVLFSCGQKWGQSFYHRFSTEVQHYYQKPIDQMEMIELMQCLKQCWKAHGWGTIAPNFDHYQQGFLVIEVNNSAFAQVSPSSNQPSCHIEAGLLSAFFSKLAGQELHCVQTSCESMGAKSNLFILGLTTRLANVESMVSKGLNHSIIMGSLGSQQA